MRAGILVALSLSAFSPLSVNADEIKVVPGAGNLAAALAKAKSGDVVKMAAGEYPESGQIAEGVTVEGAGADKTVIAPTEYAALNCRGPNVRIVGLSIRGGEKVVRGINSSTSVRVERCRFTGVAEAVALRESPLSDIVACEFVDCGIGVRAIGGASPTVWGCWFKGGATGVFSMDGSPYVRNCLFDGQKTGIRMVPHDSQPPIIRNNVFIGCEAAGIEVMAGKRSLFGPSIRNSVFQDCGAALIGPGSLTSAFSHALVHGVKEPAARDESGAETIGLGKAGLNAGNPGVKVSAAGAVTLEHPELTDSKGLRLCSEKEGTLGTLGLESTWRQLGITATATLPPARVGGKMLIANSVGEEYLYARMTGRGLGRQGMGREGDTPVDRLTPGDGKEPAEIVFDISRFFTESSLKP